MPALWGQVSSPESEIYWRKAARQTAELKPTGLDLGYKRISGCRQVKYLSGANAVARRRAVRINLRHEVSADRYAAAKLAEKSPLRSARQNSTCARPLFLKPSQLKKRRCSLC